MHRILIVKTSSLGDLIHTFPVVAYLKNKIGVEQIDWLVEERWMELVERHPLVDRAIPFDRRNWGWKKYLQASNYDAVFDLQGNTKSALGTFFARSKNKVGFAWESVTEWPNLLVTHRRFNPPPNHNIRIDLLSVVQKSLNQSIEPYDKPFLYHLTDMEGGMIDQLIPPQAIQKKVLVAPGSRWINKQLEESALVEFLMLLQQSSGLEFVFSWGSVEEKSCAERILASGIRGSILPKLNLPMLQVLMDRMALVVGMDSLPLHLAGTTSTLTFAPFGASLGGKYAPCGDRHFYLQGKCPYGEIFTHRCAKLRTCSTGACIRSISGAALFQAFTALGVMSALKSRCASTT